ncbi:MAG: alpha/beta hydrolase [Acidobacteriia bacterium]|nr:alpha/beta hydrolase [Terriglobia bacterium]
MASSYSAPERDRIQRQLAELAGSATFSSAPQLVSLLSYLVKSELDGTGHELNQARIAMDVLGRSATFDATSDSVVRVEAGRLRSRLRDYYAAEGSAAEVRFEIPKGRYSPKIHLSTATQSPAATQQIRFLKSPDGTSLAYAVSGRGRPLVKAANWLSHLEFDHQSPVWLHWWRELSARYHLVRYDVRGCGLSDWDVEFSFNTWVEDLEAVIHRTVDGPCALLGISQGAAVAIAYAVEHPERVSHLILYGGYAQGRLKRNCTEAKKEEAHALRHLIRVGWGSDHPAFRRVFASLFLPDGTPEQLASFDALQRASTSPENAVKFVATTHHLDVVELAAQVKAPTLVMHAKDELVIPIEQARLLATTIPNARLVLLEGRNHILGEAEPGWTRFLQELDTFLAE